MSVNNYNKRIEVLKRQLAEIERNTGTWQVVWQVFTDDSELLDHIEAFNLVTDRGRKLDHIPERQELIDGLNNGTLLLLNGVLRAFIVPVETSINAIMEEFNNINLKQESNSIAYKLMEARVTQLWSN